MRVGKRLTWRSVAASAVLLVVALWGASATATDAVRVRADWDKLGDTLIDGSGAVMSPESPVARSGPGRGSVPWVGAAPRLSVGARDGTLLWEYLGPSDTLRLSRSSRVLVSKIRLTEGLVAPFAQIGLGRWRVDAGSLAALPTDMELAAQVGAGLEVRVTPYAVLALEIDRTELTRASRELQGASCPHRLWGSLLAARAVF